MKFKNEANIIKIIRSVYSWTQADMAKKMDTTLQFVCNIEHGNGQIPLKRLKKLKLPRHHLEEILNAKKKDLEFKFWRAVK